MMAKFLAFVLLAFTFPVLAENPIQFKLAPRNKEHEFIRENFRGGQHTIYASGEIVEGTADRLASFVKSQSIQNALVVFNSPGGSLMEGLKLGQTIRDLGFDTAIWAMGENYLPSAKVGVCASACAYAFAGGIFRHFNDGSGKLGIHQFYKGGNNQGDIGDSQVISGTLVNYLQSMGVDVKAFVVASFARADEMIWLTEQQAYQLGFSNNGSTPTTVELKLNIQHPYLKLEQGHREAITRLLFNCGSSRELSVMAGIVTTPEISQKVQAGVARSFFESEKGEFLVESGNNGSGIFTSGSVLWLVRKLEVRDLMNILESKRLGIWTNDGGPFNRGTYMDMTQLAREKILEFAKNCSSPLG